MRELLAQWPDHPALQLTQSVCERLRGFRPGTPLMKFVTGSELLLRHCSEWEAVACRATSIKPQIDALAALVLRWRKMELAAWPDLLARSARKERERALLTVWVRLFRLINAPLWRSAAAGVDGAAGTLEPDEDEAAADGDEDDDAERAHLRGFFEALEHMMTGAEAGGFDGYLELLRGFERQLRAEDVLDDGGELGAGVARRRRRAYADIIHHVASYYGQFSGALRRAVEAERGVIEAKLKDFATLAQWSDRNYAALRASVERCHSQLNRCVRDHQDLLRRPAQALLAAAPEKEAPEETAATAQPSSGADGEASVVAALRAAAAATAAASASSGAAPPSALSQLLSGDGGGDGGGGGGHPQCARLPSVSARMLRLCEASALGQHEAARSTARLSWLGELRGVVVERAAALRAQTGKKARMGKLKAVTDLLKQLGESGLSYHASAADARQKSMADLFLSPAAPLPFAEACGGASSELAGRWERGWRRSEELYYRCLLKLTQLRENTNTAHRDLSQRQVQKAAGFVEHGFSLLSRQREMLQAALPQLSSLQRALAQLRALHAATATPAAAGDDGGGDDGGGLGSQRHRSKKLLSARDAHGDALHLAVESAVLFEQLAALPRPDVIGGAAAATKLAAAVGRCAHELHASRATLEPAARAAESDASIVTPAHSAALDGSLRRAAALRDELDAAARGASDGEVRLLGPLLRQVGALAAGGEAEMVGMPGMEAEVEAAGLAEQLNPPHGREVLARVVGSLEQAVVEMMLAAQGLRALASRPPPRRRRARRRARRAPPPTRRRRRQRRRRRRRRRSWRRSRR